jgi:hypothetical protein
MSLSMSRLGRMSLSLPGAAEPTLRRMSLKRCSLPRLRSAACVNRNQRACCTRPHGKLKTGGAPEDGVRKFARFAFLRGLVEAIEVQLPHKRGKVAVLEVPARAGRFAQTPPPRYAQSFAALNNHPKHAWAAFALKTLAALGWRTWVGPQRSRCRPQGTTSRRE